MAQPYLTWRVASRRSPPAARPAAGGPPRQAWGRHNSSKSAVAEHLTADVAVKRDRISHTLQAELATAIRRQIRLHFLFAVNPIPRSLATGSSVAGNSSSSVISDLVQTTTITGVVKTKRAPAPTSSGSSARWTACNWAVWRTLHRWVDPIPAVVIPEHLRLMEIGAGSSPLWIRGGIHRACPSPSATRSSQSPP